MKYDMILYLAWENEANNSLNIDCSQKLETTLESVTTIEKCFTTSHLIKNLAYGRQSISGQMRIVAPPPRSF